MKPVSPVLPQYDLTESTLSKPGCEDLPVVMDTDGGATSRWLLTPEDIARVVEQGFIYVHQRNAANGVQPIWLGVDPPIVPAEEAENFDSVLNADEIDYGG